MANHMKRCGCRACRRGLRTKNGGEIVRKAVRRFRHKSKESLRKGEIPDSTFSVEYTD